MVKHYWQNRLYTGINLLGMFQKYNILSSPFDFNIKSKLFQIYEDGKTLATTQYNSCMVEKWMSQRLRYFKKKTVLL